MSVGWGSVGGEVDGAFEVGDGVPGESDAVFIGEDFALDLATTSRDLVGGEAGFAESFGPEGGHHAVGRARDGVLVDAHGGRKDA